MKSPPAATDPNTDEVLVEDEVTVKCVVEADSANAAVDPSSVRIRALDANGVVVLGLDEKPMNVAGVPTGETNEFGTTFALATVPTGVVSFQCSARGVTSNVSGSASVTSLVDHGPSIIAKLPEVDSPHALNGVMAVEFQVLPAPVTAADTEATVASVVLHVAGEPVVATEDAQNKGTYRASIDFNDKTIFEEPPSEHSFISIEATNARTPFPGGNGISYPFIVDGTGPTISVTSPPANSAVNGDTVISFSVADSGVGVDLDSVEIKLAGTTVSYEANNPAWTHGGNSFTYKFNTGTLDGVQSQIDVRVEATDAVGNPAVGANRLLYLDDKAPWLDLDPGNARAKTSDDKCSASFDPLGRALNDLDITTARNSLFRALVYDQTNFGSGQNVAYMAGTDRDSVQVYVQPNPAVPLLVDKSGDGKCDALDTDGLETSSLKAVPKGGTFVTGQDGGVSPLPAGICTLSNPPATPPKTMCSDSSDMTTVVQHEIATGGDEPVVYARGDLPAAECTGTTWDLGVIPGIGTSQTGWICLAASAKDRKGNEGISRPLRICYAPDGAQPPCTTGAPPPSCADNCTPPDPYPAHIYRF
jgi:hypothetical protein